MSFSLVLLAAGGWLCLLNFYLSFLRGPLLHARSVPRDQCRHVSGYPVLGSALVVAAMVQGLDSPVALGGACLLALMDTGGLHWFALSLIVERRRARRRR